MKTDFNTLYENTVKNAEAEAQQRDEESRKQWAQQQARAQEERKWFNDLFNKTAERIDTGNEQAMQAEINAAKEEVEAEVRAKYHERTGARKWNESDTDKAWRELVRKLK